MTDREFKTAKARVDAISNRWFDCLGLRWWRISIEYSREPLIPQDSMGGSWETIARTSVKWEYLDAVITINMPAIVDMDDDRLEHVFVHECVHVLVNEMRMWGTERLSEEKSEEAIKHEERVVCALTCALLWTRKAGAVKAARGRKQK